MQHTDAVPDAHAGKQTASLLPRDTAAASSDSDLMLDVLAEEAAQPARSVEWAASAAAQPAPAGAAAAAAQGAQPMDPLDPTTAPRAAQPTARAAGAHDLSPYEAAASVLAALQPTQQQSSAVLAAPVPSAGDEGSPPPTRAPSVHSCPASPQGKSQTAGSEQGLPPAVEGSSMRSRPWNGVRAPYRREVTEFMEEAVSMGLYPHLARHLQVTTAPSAQPPAPPYPPCPAGQRAARSPSQVPPPPSSGPACCSLSGGPQCGAKVCAHMHVRMCSAELASQEACGQCPIHSVFHTIVTAGSRTASAAHNMAVRCARRWLTPQSA